MPCLHKAKRKHLHQVTKIPRLAGRYQLCAALCGQYYVVEVVSIPLAGNTTLVAEVCGPPCHMGNDDQSAHMAETYPGLWWQGAGLIPYETLSNLLQLKDSCQWCTSWCIFYSFVRSLRAAAYCILNLSLGAWSCAQKPVFMLKSLFSHIRIKNMRNSLCEWDQVVKRAEWPNPTEIYA